MKRSGNWGSRKRQHIDSRRQASYFIFLLDTKALFLINNQQPEIFELNLILIKDGMSANQNIDFALLDLGNGFLLLLGRTETADYINLRRKIHKPGTERLIMLLRQHRSRY